MRSGLERLWPGCLAGLAGAGDKGNRGGLQTNDPTDPRCVKCPLPQPLPCGSVALLAPTERGRSDTVPALSLGLGKPCVFPLPSGSPVFAARTFSGWPAGGRQTCRAWWGVLPAVSAAAPQPAPPTATDTRARDGYGHLPLSGEWFVMQQKLADTETYLWKVCAPRVLPFLSLVPFHLPSRWWVLLVFYSCRRVP